MLWVANYLYQIIWMIQLLRNPWPQISLVGDTNTLIVKCQVCFTNNDETDLFGEIKRPILGGKIS